LVCKHRSSELGFSQEHHDVNIRRIGLVALLVGPRPIPAELEHCGSDAVLVFMSLKPGMTGAWAVSGRSRIGYPDRADRAGVRPMLVAVVGSGHPGADDPCRARSPGSALTDARSARAIPAGRADLCHQRDRDRKELTLNDLLCIFFNGVFRTPL